MLAVGLSIAACQAGYSVYFSTLEYIVQNLREAEATGHASSYRSRDRDLTTGNCANCRPRRATAVVLKALAGDEDAGPEVGRWQRSAGHVGWLSAAMRSRAETSEMPD